MAYRLAPFPRHPFAPVREVAAVASEIADSILIHRTEAQDVVDTCQRRVVAGQSSQLNELQLATLNDARTRGFVLEIFDGCKEGEIVESMHIVVMPELPLYVTFSSASHETLHMPALQRLARGLRYKIEPVEAVLLLELLILDGGRPVVEA